MADPTLVNGQITDAITQANVKVLGDAPAQALGTVYQAMAQSTSLSMDTAISFQQEISTVQNAVTTQGTNGILSLDTAAGGRATRAMMM
jgi:hypothetical protein